MFRCTHWGLRVIEDKYYKRILNELGGLKIIFVVNESRQHSTLYDFGIDQKRINWMDKQLLDSDQVIASKGESASLQQRHNSAIVAVNYNGDIGRG